MMKTTLMTDKKQTIEELLKALWSFRKVIIAFTFIATITAIITLSFMKKKYDSSVLLMISEPKLEITTRYIEPIKIRNYSQLVTSNSVLDRAFTVLKGSLKSPPVPFNSAVLKSMIDVELLRDSHLVQLRVRALHPEDSAKIANTLADAYVAHVRSIAERSAHKIQELIQTQITETRDRLNTIDEELKSFMLDNGITDLNTERELILQRIDKLKSEKQLKESEREGLTASITMLSESLDSQSQLLTVTSYLGKKPIMEEKMSSQAGKEKETKENVITETVVNENYQKVWLELAKKKSDLASWNEEITQLNGTIKALQQEVTRYPELEIKYQKLIAQSELLKDVLKNLNKQFDEARVLVASKSGDLEIVDYAAAPLHHSFPKRLQFAFLAMILSFFFSLFCILLWQFIQSPPDDL